MKKKMKQVKEVIKRKIRRSDDYLDLTSTKYKKDKKWSLVGLEIRQRAYKKIPLILSIIVLILTSFIPGPNIPGFWLTSKILGRWG